MRLAFHAAAVVLAATLLAGVRQAGAEAVPLPPDIDARIASAATSPNPTVISTAVIEAIAARPDLLRPIMLRATRASPAYSARIAAEAAHAFPGFAPEIAAAAAEATPEQAAVIAQVATPPADAPEAASYSEVQAAVAGTPGVEPAEPSDWTVRLGAGVGVAPEYLGADNYEVVPLPLVEVEYANRVFLRASGTPLTVEGDGTMPQGLGVYIYRSPNWAFGPRVTLDMGRDNDEDFLLAGTQDVDTEVEIGLFWDFYTGGWNLGGDFRQGVGAGDNSHEGFLASMHVAYGTRLSRSQFVLAGVDVTYAGGNYMRTYFNSGGYVASAGIRDASAYLTLEQSFTDDIFGRLLVRGRRLFMDASESPISDPDSDNQFYVGALGGYRF